MLEEFTKHIKTFIEIKKKYIFNREDRKYTFLTEEP